MLEGWKAWALPVVATVLLAVFFAYRCSMSERDEATSAPAKENAAPTKTRREQIEAAVADLGASAPPLPDRYRDAVDTALAPLLERCRKPRPDDAALTLALHVEVAGAERLGGVVRAIEIRSTPTPSASFVACIEEGSRALALPDPAATGAGRYDLEVAP